MFLIKQQLTYKSDHLLKLDHPIAPLVRKTFVNEKMLAEFMFRKLKIPTELFPISRQFSKTRFAQLDFYLDSGPVTGLKRSNECSSGDGKTIKKKNERGVFPPKRTRNYAFFIFISFLWQQQKTALWNRSGVLPWWDEIPPTICCCKRAPGLGLISVWLEDCVGHFEKSRKLGNLIPQEKKSLIGQITEF